MSRVIGLTGGIATGKSTVSRILEELGAVVIDADRIVREVQSPGSPALAEIEEAFGSKVIDPRGSLDRKALGEIVFRDPEARRRLNDIVHPRVGAEMARRLEAARSAAVPLVVLDVALLLEGRRAGRNPGGPDLDAVVVVYAREEQQIERQMARDGCDRSEAERRVAAQIPIEEKKTLADLVIDNSGSLADTERQASELYGKLLRSSS